MPLSDSDAKPCGHIHLGLELETEAGPGEHVGAYGPVHDSGQHELGVLPDSPVYCQATQCSGVQKVLDGAAQPRLVPPLLGLMDAPPPPQAAQAAPRGRCWER